MAEVIKKAKGQEPDGPGRPAKYPWSVWSDGQARRAVRGEDFGCSCAGFRAGLYNWAKNNSMHAHITFYDDNVVEFYIDRKAK